MNPLKIILKQTKDAELTNDICKQLIDHMKKNEVVIVVENGRLRFLNVLK